MLPMLYTSHEKESCRRKRFKEPPNGLAFSCREHAKRTLQNANDLVREAVSCNAGLDGNERMWK